MLIAETLLLSLPMPMITVFLMHSCGESIRRSRLFRAVLILWAAFLALLSVAPFIDSFIYITQENKYYNGPLFPLLTLPVILILLLNFAGTVRRRRQLSRKVRLGLFVALVPLTAALILNLFVDAIPLFDLSYILSALAMYGLILSDEIEQDRLHQREIVRQQQEIARQQQEMERQQQEMARQQREIARERASVMVLQMRPHFIYNTLMSIYSLCRTDPEKTRQVTLDFANYLRRNFNAIATDGTIPFSTELDHARAYLSVEQAQYDDMLVVDFDTPFTRFRVPPLTLQPIVENAVKHGMDLDSDPLHISIRTRSTDSGALIIVEDNGPGFDPEEDGGPHTTLVNIRQRLDMMCAGTMTILPREGGGTVVKITIR